MKRNRLILLTAMFALVALALPVLAQGKKEAPTQKQAPSANKEDKSNKANPNEKTQASNLKLTISSVVKEDANAKSVAEGRLIPVRFVWLCGSEGNAKLVALEAKLITLNTDGKQTVVTKRLSDWTLNKPITSLLELPMAKDVFAKNFTLELVGKFHDGVVERAVNTSKQGSFPVPRLTEQKR